MNKLILLSYLLICANAANSLEIDNFPESCSEATTRRALPGHMIRLGMVQETRRGLMFSFPDQNDPDNLQRVEIADNVGLIGQDPSRDYSNMIKLGTPSGSFVVAQVFIGNEDNEEPVVTCLSQVRPLSSYIWSDYGRAWRWLEPEIFIERLRWRKYSRWNWRKWHRDDFSSIRRRFRDSSQFSKFRKASADSIIERRARRDRLINIGKDIGTVIKDKIPSERRERRDRLININKDKLPKVIIAPTKKTNADGRWKERKATINPDLISKVKNSVIIDQAKRRAANIKTALELKKAAELKKKAEEAEKKTQTYA